MARRLGALGLMLAVAACGGDGDAGHGSDDPSGAASSSAGADDRAADAPGDALFEAWDLGLAPIVTGREDCPTILEVNGGGLALFDADGDGDLDLLLVSPGAYPAAGVERGGTTRLYRNDAGVFTDVTAGSGVDVPVFANAVAVGDVDADGDRDLYLTCLGPNQLLLNDGGMRFRAVADASGAAGPDDGWSTSALFTDLDLDGDPDLYVVDYLAFDPEHPPTHGVDGRTCTWKAMPVMCGPQGLPAQPDHVYENVDGRFVDRTEAWGFSASPSYGLGVLGGDFDLDGRPDIYVTNDSLGNFLFLGDDVDIDGDAPRWREAGVLGGAALSARGREQAGMGVAAGDVEGDGDEDLLVTNFSMESNALYFNVAPGRFSDRGDASGVGGVSRTLLGWGVAFVDADLDGDLDVLGANGHVYPQADEPGTDTSWWQPDVLLLNDGEGRFQRVPWPGDAPAPSRALAVGDLDDDGVSDVVVLRRSGAPAVWRGRAPGRTLQVLLAGPAGNPDVVGATVRWDDEQGSRVARVRATAGFQAYGDPRPVFAWRGPGRLTVTLPGGGTIEQDVDGPGRVEIDAR